MSEQNRYVNAYIDNAVGLLHEYLAAILQTKSQLRVANELVVEKDKIISALQAELDQHKSSLTDKNSAIQNAQKWEADYNAMKNKVSHMDTLLHQMNDMKKTIVDKTEEYNKMILIKDANYNSIVTLKDAEIEKLKKKIADLQSSKKSINRKKPSEVSKAIVEEATTVLPVELSKVDTKEESTVLPVVLPIVHEKKVEQPRETDDF